MNKSEKIISDLNGLGIDLYRNSGRIRWRCQKNSVSKETIHELKRLKPRILPLLKTEPPNLMMLKPFPNRFYNGDCLKVMKHLPDNSVDVIVTDPPYGLKFMDKDWDKAVPTVETLKECLRVLKPGAFAFIMCSPRQDLQHRMTDNLERAGFYSGFSPVYWTYANGLPKAHSISKTLEKMARKQSIEMQKFEGAYAGFQPKPAVEVILVVMKPLDKKGYINQALSNGKGVTWMGDCLVPYSEKNKPSAGRRTKHFGRDIIVLGDKSGAQWQANPEGRFASNILVSDDVLGDYSQFFSLNSWAEKLNLEDLPPSVQETLPYLVVPKPSTREREAGLDSLEKKQVCGRDKGQDMRNNAYKIRPTFRKNIHPTVKPIELMTYLITMGSRESDVVLDPFMGSGTTCLAALSINRRVIGIELKEDYYEIACERFSSAFMKKHEKAPGEGRKQPWLVRD